ncbi:Hydrolethalus syndrome protein 1 C-terminal domain [Trinorchestia longiramus]|nr:Hydrolethalus syndrome protein 1 C-terminal domain [Trinorchestia longiramus]
MPYRLRISEEEVRDELRHLGYGEVPPHIVASFRKDLLKCIKNDIKKLKEHRNASTEQSSSSSIPYSSSSSQSMSSGQYTSVSKHYASASDQHSTSSHKFQTDSDQYSSSFYSSQAESDQSVSSFTRRSCSQPSLTSSQLTDLSLTSSLQRPTKHYQRRGADEGDDGDDGESGYSDGSDDMSESAPSSRTAASSTSSSGVSSSGGRERERAAGSSGGLTLQDSGSVRAKRAPSLPPYPSRTDPVSLYHYYKAHWDQRPAPGDDPRMALRWKIRADLFYSK